MIDRTTIETTIAATPVEVVGSTMLVVKLSPDAPHPAHAIASFKDDSATTVIVPESKFFRLNTVVATKGPFRLLRFALPEPSAPRGFLSSLSSTLAFAGITVLLWSTFDAEYALIRADMLTDALSALAERGFPVED
jgi:hypothetical protein